MWDVAVRINPTAVRAIRVKDGQSQVGLARAVGITKAAMHDIESGRRTASPAVRKAIAAALNVPISAIESSIADPDDDREGSAA